MSRSRSLLLVLSAVFFTALLLTSCGRQSSDVLADAYVAPVSLNLRRELGQRNSTVAVLKHGDRVSIIDVHRRFVKIRTQSGEEGWVDALQLLSSEQMQQIRRDAREARALPSEGQATVYEALNIHLEPDRHSPAFARIPENGSVTVLAQRVVARSSGPPKIPKLVPDRPAPLSPREKRERESKKANRWLPPPPLPPKPPANWQELSTERVDGAESIAELKADRDEAAGKKATEAPKAAIPEEWTLVRTKDGQCGWVLSRNLILSIPDEVAQYAEGKRITSYFDLGAVQDDEKGLKHNWLWTTASQIEPFDYDSWRVFLWSRRRHRYETSHRQRDVEGYFPIHVDAADPKAPERTFQLITRDEDGKFRKRTYFFDGVRVHLTATEDYHPSSAAASKARPLEPQKLQANRSRPGWFKRHWGALKQRLFGAG